MTTPTPSLLHKHTYLTDVQNALLSATAVVIACILGHERISAMSLGLLIVSTQSVAGINVQGSILRRISGAGQAGLILMGAGLLAHLVNGFLPFTLLAVVILAFSFAMIRQRFPHNWPDINIPAAVIFFMSYSHANPLEVLTIPAIGATIGLGLNFFASLLVPATPEQDQDSLSPTTALAWYKLRPELQSYAIQLSLLLVIGWLAFRWSGFSFGYWLPFTAIIVLQTNPTNTRKKMLDRIIGTTTGCLVGSLLLQTQLGFLLQVSILATCIFCFIYFVKKSYAVAVAFITTFVLLLIGSQAEQPLQIVWERLGFTFAGGLLTYLCSFLFQTRKDKS